MFEGSWKDELFHGKGQENWPDGSWFKGEY